MNGYVLITHDANHTMIQVSVNRIKREPDQVNRINWIMNRIK